MTQESTGYRTLAAFPIVKNSALLGAISLYSSEAPEYSTTQQKLMREATALMAAALVAAQETDAWESSLLKGDAPPLAAPGASLGLADAMLEYELTH